jgi:hypothetical protein
LDWKNNWKSPFFVRRGDHCHLGGLYGLTTILFLWVACRS